VRKKQLLVIGRKGEVGMIQVFSKAIEDFGVELLHLFRNLLSNLNEEELAISKGDEALFDLVLQKRLELLHIFERINDEFIALTKEADPGVEEMTLVGKLLFYKEELGKVDCSTAILLQQLLDVINKVMRQNKQLKMLLKERARNFETKKIDRCSVQEFFVPIRKAKIGLAVLELGQTEKP